MTLPVRYSILALALFAGSALLAPVGVRAQDKIPSISIPRSPLEGGAGFGTGTEKPEFTYGNPYMNDTLQLQYQITLLERMVQRQSNISRLEKTYLEMGVSYPQPAPPRGICEQIPANVPCFNAYPDLYDIALPDIGQLDTEAIEGPETGQAALAPVIAAPQTEEEVLPEYTWAEVSCSAGKCSAVITKQDQSTKRETVRAGDVLGDGTEIVSISGRGVRARIDGKEMDLRPALAPSRGGSASPRFGAIASASNARDPFSKNSQAEDALARSLGNTPPVVAEPSEPAAAPTPPVEAQIQKLPDEPIEDPGPPLGPTGLF